MKKAFTLIELLVTIAIIGILATILLVSFTNSKAKSRDSQRKADVQAIAAALDLYHSDENKYRIGHAASYQETKWNAMARVLKGYIDPLPKDPINNMDGNDAYDHAFRYPVSYDKSYSYAVYNYPTCACTKSDGSINPGYPNLGGYCITANLETETGNGSEYHGKLCGNFSYVNSPRQNYLYVAERHSYVPSSCPATPASNCD